MQGMQGIKKKKQVRAEGAENAEGRTREEEGTCFPGRKHGTAQLVSPLL
jgi:hypothetical protein